MSGTTMRIAFDDAPLRLRLAAWALAKPAAFNSVLQDIGEDVLGDVQDNIAYQKLADGSGMPQSAAAVKRGGKTLLDRGHLRDSYAYQIAGGILAVGSNMVYAAIHHFGGKTGRGHKINITARPVLGINSQRELAIGDKLGKALLEMGS